MLLPVVKWVGGKRQLMKEILNSLPESYDTYYEPFFGGGAVFFNLKPQKAYINDVNKDLFAIYSCLMDKDLLHKMSIQLHIHQEKHNDDYYYKIRREDREDDFKEKPIFEKAARAIYLNKAGFNGLYRVNSKGEFNVPSGHYEKVNLVRKELYESIHRYFVNHDIKLTSKDFEDAVSSAYKGDFVYLDPPYDTLEPKDSFVAYDKNKFNRDDQKRVFKVFKDLDAKGVYVMMSNHDTEFIRNLYKGYYIKTVEANRMVNSKGNERGKVKEVIVTNYKTS